MTGAIASDGNSYILFTSVSVKNPAGFIAATDDLRVSSCINNKYSAVIY